MGLGVARRNVHCLFVLLPQVSYCIVAALMLKLSDLECAACAEFLTNQAITIIDLTDKLPMMASGFMFAASMSALMNARLPTKAILWQAPMS